MTSPSAAPLRPTLRRAEGLYVWDAEDRRYLDATSGAFCMQLGYSRLDLVRAMSDTATRLPHARPSLFDSEESQAYRAALLSEVGPPFTTVLFTSSGSEAVDLAIKVAWWHQRFRGRPDRRLVLSLSGHYHGATLGSLEATGWTERRAPFEGLLGARESGPAAYCVRCFRQLTAPACAFACAEAAMEKADVAAAIIAESVPAPGLAAAVPPPGWTARLRARCDETGALWIADEVLTGFGRTGDLFAWKRLAEPDCIAPDLVVFGKGASAGYFPLGGVLISERVAESLGSEGEGSLGAEWTPFRHAQTFGGNPPACAVGLRALTAFREEGFFQRVRRMEEEVRGAFESLGQNESVLEARGIGFLWGVELAEPVPGRPPYPRARRVAERIAAGCRARGVLVHGAVGFAEGGLGDAILIAPPLIADFDAIARIVDVLRDSIAVVVPTGAGRPWIEEWEDR